MISPHLAAEIKAEKNIFQKYLKVSLISHACLFAALFIQAFVFQEVQIPYEKSIRVDLVGLPDKLPEIEAPAAIPEAKKESVQDKTSEAAKPEPIKKETAPKEPEAISLDKTKTKQKKALEKLKQMQALEQIQKELEQESKKKAATAASKTKFAGNVISPGTALTGVNKLQADAYIDAVHQHMIAHWALPEYLRNRNLKAYVLVKFDENGNVLEKAITKSSGNPSFDEHVLEAIDQSSPVPRPPGKFARISSLQGFSFVFSLDR
jgi:colicin import membrane protein